MSAPDPDIVYILGAGRSGTTLLDVVLGNGDGMFSCGEIRKFLELDGRPAAMAEGSANWRFWDGVRAAVNESFSAGQRARLAAAARRMESHAWFPLQWLGLPVVSRADRELYARYVEVLLGAISARSGQSVLIDSSKYPGRVLALLPVLGDRLRAVYIRRPRKAVVTSFRKKGIEQPAKSWLAANVYWLVMRIACGLAYRRVPAARRSSVSYDGLVEKPARSLADVARDLDLDLRRPMEIASRQGDFAVGWLFEGNRIRKLDSMAIQRRPA